MFSFETMNQNLLKNKQETVVSQANMVYILSMLTGANELREISFDLIDLEVLQSLQEDIYDLIIHIDDEDAYEPETELNPDHEYTKLLGIENIIYEFGKQEKQRVPSSFRFL